MWERMKPIVDGYLVVTLKDTKNAMRLLAEKARVIAEGAVRCQSLRRSVGKLAKGRSSRSCPVAISICKNSAN